METAARNSKKPLPAPAAHAMALGSPGGPSPTLPGGQVRSVAVAASTGNRTPAATPGARPSSGTAKTGSLPAMPAPSAGPGGMDLAMLASAGTAAENGTEEERARAKLPPPPEEDSQLQVLLRPGLLTDVEITVEKIPNAIHIPAQAIFDKDGRPTVWVQRGRRFEQRPVKLARRSESTMVIAEGLKPGEVIALADPTVKPGEKKNGKKAGAAMPGMPAGSSSGAKEGK